MGDAPLSGFWCPPCEISGYATVLNVTARGAFLKLKGDLYSAYIQCIMMFGSETWVIKVDDLQCLERMEKMGIRWMCDMTLKDRK